MARPRSWGSRLADDLLSVQGLRAGYGETEVLRGIDLVVSPGEIVAVLGSNGVGKSTLNRTLSGVVRARAGAIQFEGAAIEHEGPPAIVARGLIHVPEGRRIFPNMTVSENLDLGSYRRARVRRQQNRERVFGMFPRLRERTTQYAGTLSGVVRARAGAIHFDGAAIEREGPPAIVARGLIHVPEGRRIFPNMTVSENLDLGSYRRARARRQQNRERVFGMFPRLRERTAQYAGTLSGGEQQMLAIGRGLMAEPKLLILDEPSLGLSPLLVEELFAFIARIRTDGVAILLVEQNVVQSLEVADRAYILAEGTFVMSGAAAAIANDPELKRAYLGL